MLWCLGLQGCRTVQPSEITGTRIVTDQSRQRFFSVSQRAAAARITLDTSGAFTATEVPEDLLYGFLAADRLVTGTGIWKLVSREGGQQVRLQFNAITAGQRGNVPYDTNLYVSTGLTSTVGLFYFRGDPDEGRRIEFEKK
jgi:hypothetical protein